MLQEKDKKGGIEENSEFVISNRSPSSKRKIIILAKLCKIQFVF